MRWVFSGDVSDEARRNVRSLGDRVGEFGSRHSNMREIDRVVGSFLKMIEEQRTRGPPDFISIAKDTVSHPTIRVDRCASKNSTGRCLTSGRLRVDDGPGLHQLRMGVNQLEH